MKKTLKIYDGIYPALGESLVFEIRKKANEYFVLVGYINKHLCTIW